MAHLKGGCFSTTGHARYCSNNCKKKVVAVCILSFLRSKSDPRPTGPRKEVLQHGQVVHGPKGFSASSAGAHKPNPK